MPTYYARKDNMDKDIHILTTDRCPEIVNGLNIMAAVATNPKCRPALKEVMLDLYDQGHEIAEMFNCLEQAHSHLMNLNKMLKDAGVEPTGRM
jgi:hypothetical protein